MKDEIQAIEQHARAGATARVEELRADGTPGERGVDVPIVELRLSEKAIAYLGAGGDRAHAHRVTAIHREGDDFIVEVESPGIRLVVGMVAFASERAALERYRPAPPAAVADLERLFDALSR